MALLSDCLYSLIFSLSLSLSLSVCVCVSLSLFLFLSCVCLCGVWGIGLRRVWRTARGLQ
jgi:hypothetical protein